MTNFTSSPDYNDDKKRWLYEVFAIVAWPATGGSSMHASHVTLVHWLWVRILLSPYDQQDRCVHSIVVYYSGLAGCSLSFTRFVAVGRSY
jgi:hypothetical protein